MKRIASQVLFIMLAMALTLTACSPYQSGGSVAGGAMGGIAGAILDSRNPWRGGVIGAALGSIAGATISDISVRGSHEAAQVRQPVEYRTEDGRGRYRAEPLPEPANAQTRCRKVRERVYEGDRLIRDHIKEICEGEKFERNY